ncbi:hypothetical protein GJ744_003280 [Endocarpon pusillum]|uniref:Uncharacterized protein n=1 Tax=Endocarpon pusillum TaxID=364733 RepID=A0A8H7E0Q2_9EURO|nr:hypothetical protein GJ744_003280 [Endocarpon pusillum]
MLWPVTTKSSAVDAFASPVDIISFHANFTLAHTFFRATAIPRSALAHHNLINKTIPKLLRHISRRSTNGSSTFQTAQDEGFDTIGNWLWLGQCFLWERIKGSILLGGLLGLLLPFLCISPLLASPKPHDDASCTRMSSLLVERSSCEKIGRTSHSLYRVGPGSS